MLSTFRSWAGLGAIAQLVAHLHGMEGVRGSNPLSTTSCLPGQLTCSQFLFDSCFESLTVV